MTSKISVFLVDDEPKSIKSLKQVLMTFFDNIEVVGTSNSVNDAFIQITEKKPQLVFLDIEMGEGNGFQLLRKFDHIDFHIVFVTAHEEYALQAIKFSALDYIIKPAGIADLSVLIEKVGKQQRSTEDLMKVKHMFGNFLTEDKSEHKITLPVSDGYEFVKVDDILYLRSDGGYTHFHLKESKIVSSKNLKFFEEILIPYGFNRIHNSTLINLKYIKKIGKGFGGFVIMEDDSEWGISRSRKEQFLKIIDL